MSTPSAPPFAPPDPTDSPTPSTPRTDWRSVVALNAVSTLSQIGQYGIAFVVLPLWLAARGLDAAQLGWFAGALWLGQLPGLALAPRLSARFGPRRVIGAGLAATVLALLGLLALDPAQAAGGIEATALAQAMAPERLLNWALPAGALAGFGLGLRWIGLEPWLYGLTPSAARGRLVGLHETLIGLAPIAAPAVATWAGVAGRAPLAFGIGVTLLAALPLALARPHRAVESAEPDDDGRAAPPQAGRADAIDPLRLGLGVAVVGGWIEGTFTGLFAPFASGRGLDEAASAALLTAFGVGGLVCQFGVGWLADRVGLARTAWGCALGTALVAAAIALLPAAGSSAEPAGSWNSPLMGLLFALGGLVTAYLTLAIIGATSQRASSGPTDLFRQVSRVSITYTASAAIGPLVMGPAMKAWGSEWLIAQLVGVALLMTLLMTFGLTAWLRRDQARHQARS